MIELNLLPEESRKRKKETAKLTKFSVVSICVGIIVVFFAVHGVLLAFVSSDRNRLKILENTWKSMKTEREKTSMVVEETTRVKKHLSIIRKILDPGFCWPGMLLGLNQSMIDNIWLDKLELVFSTEGKGKSKKRIPIAVNIAGYAVGSSQEATSRVAKFITSLKGNKNFSSYFNEIELKNMRSYDIEDVEVMRFRLDCGLN
ncbi:MAG: hypothetical protein KAI70_06825 [Candidatus Omnitrophica bacterium]|nr:hypothetical protein [Candidatus Omnitrophota bacterium]